MYDYFKNIAEKGSCTFGGACSIHPSINSLYLVLLDEIREMSFYIVKLKEFSFENLEANNLALEVLSTFMINTNFNQMKYLKILKTLNIFKKKVKSAYVEFCEKNAFPCETIKASYYFDDNILLSQLIEYYEKNIAIKQKKCDSEKLRLFELITIQARLCAINIIKLKNLDENVDRYSYEVLRYFALTNSFSIRNEKIIRRILEFSKIFLEIEKKLLNLYEKKYGQKINADILVSQKQGHCILVSGDDLDELEKLLKTIDSNNLSEKINVYTHGPLFLAHFYPYFKNHPALIGHLGSDNTEYDFSNFSGAILITRNFIQKIDSLYRGEIFSHKLISFNKVFDIVDDDYFPVLEMSMKLDGCKQENEVSKININYETKKIDEFFENFENNELAIILGNNLEDNSRKFSIQEYKNKKILFLNIPLENEILINAIDKMLEKNIKITLFFTSCNISALSLLLALLSYQIDFVIANCSHSLINPHVIEALNKEFSVKVI